jgi:ATP-dependent RNA helicase MSS116, mitochondrial
MGKKRHVDPANNDQPRKRNHANQKKTRLDREAQAKTVKVESTTGQQNNVTTASTRQTPAELVPVDTPKFEEFKGRINRTVLTTLSTDLGFERMTPIQALTIDPLLEGKDVLGQAKTGTGKTIAFLIPAIENFLRSDNKLVSILVISPTRELVNQIAAEAEKLLRRFPNVHVATAIGGTNKDTEARRISRGCQVLVATPGRLLDHLQEENMQHQLSALNTFVLDEADRMLDMGFLPDINKIISYLPQKSRIPRQSMLFSATVPESILNTAKTILNMDYHYISTIPKGESTMHKRVPQYLVTVVEMNDLAPALLSIVASEIEDSKNKDFKAILFTPTAVQADYYSHILKSFARRFIRPIQISAMHSRMSQNKRTALTNEFKTARNAILVATDVIARGMDFPLVTHVVQVGLPMNREAYVHRLGRTARADADGRGILILAQAEKSFIRELSDINFQGYPHTVSTSSQGMTQHLEDLDEEEKRKIYQGWLGYYKATSKYTRWNNAALVAEANKFALGGLGCSELPGLEKNIVGKMGLSGVRGLAVIPNKPRNKPNRRSGGG